MTHDLREAVRPVFRVPVRREVPAASQGRLRSLPQYSRAERSFLQDPVQSLKLLSQTLWLYLRPRRIRSRRVLPKHIGMQRN